MPTSAVAAGRVEIMVVDDRPDGVRTLAELRLAQGHEVLMAEDGASALALPAGQTIDAFILDIGLPDMDGDVLAQRLRAAHPQARLVALSGYGQQSDVAQALAAGFALHLTKPATLEALRRALAPA